MPQGTVVLAGVLPAEHVALDRLVAEFGWSLKQASSFAEVAELNADHSVVTVLFSPQDLALRWDWALRGVRDAAPAALPILCHRFAHAIDWPEAAQAGVFHALRLPLKLGEVRQSLGFVWEAKRRPAAATRDLPQLQKAVDHEDREPVAMAPLAVATKRA
jgi:hypothetical protein